MKILITGATGFIGSNLIKKLNKNNTIYAITRNKRYSIKNVKWVRCDLSKKINFNNFPKDLDCIIHLAQSREHKKFPEKVFDIFNINSYSTLQLLEYGRKIKIKSFILASSGGVTGYKDNKILEEDPPNPLTFYLTSKYIAESLVNSYSDYFNIVILRYFFVYGKGQKDGIVPLLINKIKNNEPIYIYGDKEGTKINPIYIDDAIHSTLHALELKEKQVINIAGRETISILKLSNLISKYLKKKPVFEYKDGPTQNMIADIEKMKYSLKVEPKISLKEGIKRILRKKR